jgi:hypothetical protein
VIRAWAAALLAVAAPFIPNDPGFEPDRASLEAMSVPQAWSLTTGDPAVVIAVVDTGVTPGPDLALTPGWNVVDGSADTSDSDGHGTAMAAIAAATIGNGIGGAGICGQCRVMPIKTDAAHVGTAIDWAVDHGASVIDVSCNDGAPAAARDAFAHGVPVFVCASENADPTAIRVGKDVSATSFGDPSAATASAAGIGGLMLTCNPALFPTEIKLILRRMHGEVNAFEAVRRAGWRATAPEIVRLMVHTRGRGTVARRPDDDTYNAGAVVVLRAKAQARWRFVRWSGLCRGQRALCTVKLTQSALTTAVFRRK